MRMRGWTAALALMAPAAAGAQDVPAASPLRSLSMLAPESGLRLGGGLRLRVDWRGLAATPISVTPMATHLRARLATAMIDLYPVGDHGFHISAGTRFLVRRDFAAEADNATRGLLYRPRWGGAGLRTGLRRFSPTATVGYSGVIAPSLTLGVEAGAGMGSAFNGMPSLRGARPMRLAADRGQRPVDRINPLVSLGMGLRF